MARIRSPKKLLLLYTEVWTGNEGYKYIATIIIQINDAQTNGAKRTILDLVSTCCEKNIS
jgi:hypothetical protein